MKFDYVKSTCPPGGRGEEPHQKQVKAGKQLGIIFLSGCQYDSQCQWNECLSKNITAIIYQTIYCFQEYYLLTPPISLVSIDNIETVKHELRGANSELSI